MARFNQFVDSQYYDLPIGFLAQAGAHLDQEAQQDINSYQGAISMINGIPSLPGVDTERKTQILDETKSKVNKIVSSGEPMDFKNRNVINGIIGEAVNNPDLHSIVGHYSDYTNYLKNRQEYIKSEGLIPSHINPIDNQWRNYIQGTQFSKDPSYFNQATQPFKYNNYNKEFESNAKAIHESGFDITDKNSLDGKFIWTYKGKAITESDAMNKLNNLGLISAPALQSLVLDAKQAGQDPNSYFTNVARKYAKLVSFSESGQTATSNSNYDDTSGNGIDYLPNQSWNPGAHVDARFFNKVQPSSVKALTKGAYPGSDNIPIVTLTGDNQPQYYKYDELTANAKKYFDVVGNTPENKDMYDKYKAGTLSIDDTKKLLDNIQYYKQNHNNQFSPSFTTIKNIPLNKVSGWTNRMYYDIEKGGDPIPYNQVGFDPDKSVIEGESNGSPIFTLNQSNDDSRVDFSNANIVRAAFKQSNGTYTYKQILMNNPNSPTVDQHLGTIVGNLKMYPDIEHPVFGNNNYNVKFDEGNQTYDIKNANGIPYPIQSITGDKKSTLGMSEDEFIRFFKSKIQQ